MFFFHLTIFLALVVVLVLVHELGHFSMAKIAGMKVEEFGFGLPPRIFGVKRGETTYSINLIPLGGFVKIHGEDSPEDRSERSFNSKSIFRRFLVLVAGVAMNVLLAALLFIVGYGVGFPAVVGSDAAQASIQVLSVAPESPAAESGIMMGDIIYSLNSQKVRDISQFQKLLSSYAGSEVLLGVKRGEETLKKEIRVRKNPPKGQGALGITIAKIGIIRYPWHKAVLEGFKSTFVYIGLMFYQLFVIIKQLLVSGHISGVFAGPVGIGKLSFQFMKVGWLYFIRFAGLISLSLAVVNILPIPALDGGRIMFLIPEAIRKRPVSTRIQRALNTAGFVFIILIFIIVTLHDILNF